MNYEESLKRLQERMAGQAARTFDRKFVDACTYAVDPYGLDEPKTATAIRAQMESVQEQMRRYQEEARRAVMADASYYTREAMTKQLLMAHPLAFPPLPRVDDAVFKWEPRRPKKELTFTALQEMVLPDLYGKKQHAQLLAAAKKREVDAAARLREETNNKIGGLLRGFLGARRGEEEL